MGVYGRLTGRSDYTIAALKLVKDPASKYYGEYQAEWLPAFNFSTWKADLYECGASLVYIVSFRPTRAT